MQEEYRISFGFQYEAWELKIYFQDTVSYETEAQAHRESENRNIFVFVTGTSIFVIEKEYVEEISSRERGCYEFSVIKDEVYERLGPSLSPQDIDQLIDAKRLEEVIFSDLYMISEDDYQIREENLPAIFEEIKQFGEPTELAGMEAYPGLTGVKGFLFESLWYSLERMK